MPRFLCDEMRRGRQRPQRGRMSGKLRHPTRLRPAFVLAAGSVAMTIVLRGTESLFDSPLEGTGFEPPVPREAAGTLLSQYQSAACCSVLADCMA